MTAIALLPRDLVSGCATCGSSHHWAKDYKNMPPDSRFRNPSKRGCMAPPPVSHWGLFLGFKIFMNHLAWALTYPILSFVYFIIMIVQHFVTSKIDRILFCILFYVKCIPGFRPVGSINNLLRYYHYFYTLSPQLLQGVLLDPKLGLLCVFTLG